MSTDSVFCVIHLQKGLLAPLTTIWMTKHQSFCVCICSKLDVHVNLHALYLYREKLILMSNTFLPQLDSYTRPYWRQSKPSPCQEGLSLLSGGEVIITEKPSLSISVKQFSRHRKTFQPWFEASQYICNCCCWRLKGWTVCWTVCIQGLQWVFVSKD